MDFNKYRKVLYIKSNIFINIINDVILDITDSCEFNIEITSNSEYVGFIYNNDNKYLIGTEYIRNGLEF